MSFSNAEWQGRWRELRAAEVERLRKTATAAELALAHAEIDVLCQRVQDLNDAAEVAQTEARATIDGLILRIKKLEEELLLERLRKPTAKGEQTPADVDGEVARLKTLNKNLRQKVKEMSAYHQTQPAQNGHMSFKASSLIAKALHPDATPSEEDRAEAFKAFSAWKGDRDAAKRR